MVELNAEWKAMIGAALLAAGAMLVWKGQGALSAVGAGVLAAGVVILLNARKAGQRAIMDERVKRASNKAYAYSWYASFLLVAALIWADIFWPNVVTVQGVLGIMLFFMSASGIAFKLWLENKPEAV